MANARPKGMMKIVSAQSAKPGRPKTVKVTKPMKVKAGKMPKVKK